MEAWLDPGEGLVAGLFLLAAFGIVATRQMLALVRLFVVQSALLALGAALIAAASGSPHLVGVALVTVAAKVVLVPWLLWRTVSRELYGRREVVQVLNIPSALLIAAALAMLGYLVAAPLARAAPAPFVAVNLPVGIAGTLLGGYTVSVRREALAQLMGLLALENGVFFAGLAIAPDLPVLAELAAAFDVLVVTLVVGLLTRRIHERVGATSVGLLAALREHD